MSSQAAAGWAGTAGIVLLGIGIPVALLIVVILLVRGGEWFRGKPKAQLVFWSLLGLFYSLGREGVSPSRPAFGWAKPTAARRKRLRRRGFALAAHPTPLRRSPRKLERISWAE